MKDKEIRNPGAAGASEGEKKLGATSEVADVGQNIDATEIGTPETPVEGMIHNKNVSSAPGGTNLGANKGLSVDISGPTTHGKEKIDAYFKAVQERGQNLFVPYIVAGDGGMARLAEQIALLEASGVAAIELGIPFSDPVADGPTIQRAGMRALEAGVTLRAVLDMLRETRIGRKVPIVLMTYFNPIFSFGVAEFAAACVDSGVDGIIVPDVPMEEEAVLASALAEHDVAFIRLVALTSTPERMRELAKRAEGFLYAVAVRGTTGARASHDESVASYLKKLTEMADVPVLAGFGVSNATQARDLSSHCDGVIVGSTIVDLFYEGKDDEVASLIEASL